MPSKSYPVFMYTHISLETIHNHMLIIFTGPFVFGIVTKLENTTGFFQVNVASEDDKNLGHGMEYC